MAGAPQPLAGDAMRRALDRIAAWRTNRDATVACPVCETAGLQIVDRSARPYAEWYALSCAACGLEAQINVPLAGPAGGT